MNLSFIGLYIYYTSCECVYLPVVWFVRVWNPAGRWTGSGMLPSRLSQAQT